MSTTRLGREALFEAYVEMDRRKNAAPELKNYSAQLLQLVSEALTAGVMLTDVRTWPREWSRKGAEQSDVAHLAESAIQHAARYMNPFPNWLEGRPPPAYAALRDRHSEKIDERTAELVAAYRALFMDAVEFLFPGIDERAVTEQDLAARGLPAVAPDPDDYW